MPNTKDPMDAYVGEHLRARRAKVGVSQTVKVTQLKWLQNKIYFGNKNSITCCRIDKLKTNLTHTARWSPYGHPGQNALRLLIT
jgi:hypothetical protein